MIGACTKPWCPSCHAPGGLDCPDASRSRKAQKVYEERQWRREAEDEMGDLERARLFAETPNVLLRTVDLGEGHQIPIPVHVIEFWSEHNCWPPLKDLLAAVWPDGKLRFIPHQTEAGDCPCPGSLRPYEESSEEKLRAEHVASLDQSAEDEVVMGVDTESEWHQRQLRMKALEAASRVLDLSMTNSLDRIQIESRGAAVVGMAKIFEQYLRDGN
jgi:hypothetical protein